jgi:hypothetical protein
MRKVMLFVLVFALVVPAVAQIRKEFVVGSGSPDYGTRDVEMIQVWEYTAGAGFGIAIEYEGVGAGNLWISDYATTYGFFECERDGTLTGGFIPVRDDGATQDCAYMIDEDYWVVGYYYGNEVDFYDSGGTLLGTINGPAGWGEPWGCAYSNDGNNIVYLGALDQIAYGTYTNPTTAISWTVLDLETGSGNVTGLGYYYPEGRSEFGKYLFGIARVEDPFTNTLFVWNVDESGVPDVNTPAYTFDMNEYLDPDGAVAGIEWDGQHLWLLDQAQGGALRLVFEFDLGISGLSITPMSLGNIKANFR